MSIKGTLEWADREITAARDSEKRLLRELEQSRATNAALLMQVEILTTQLAERSRQRDEAVELLRARLNEPTSVAIYAQAVEFLRSVERAVK